MRVRSLAAGLLVPVSIGLAVPAFSEGAPSAAEVQRKIDITRGKIAKRKGTERVLTTEISAYQRRIGSLQGRIGSLQSREDVVQRDLDLKRAELTRLQSELREERARLVRLKARLSESKTALASRMVELYQADTPDLVTVVLNADGFNQLLESRDFFQRVSDQDERILTDVRDAKADATATEAKLDTLEARQSEVTEIVEDRRDEIASIKQGLVDSRIAFEGAKANKQTALGSVREERHGLENDLEVAESQQAKIRAELAKAAAGGGLPVQAVKGSGSYIWPVNGPITGNFGEQRPGHIHAGIDIAVPEGTPIRAVADGKVALTQGIAASGGYGNYTCVQHTSTVSSCYAHQSRFGVAVGQSVKQGQVIGYSGNTGHSFGPHLHFEIRVNGVPTQPLNYLS